MQRGLTIPKWPPFQGVLRQALAPAPLAPGPRPLAFSDDAAARCVTLLQLNGRGRRLRAAGRFVGVRRPQTLARLGEVQSGPPIDYPRYARSVRASVRVKVFLNRACVDTTHNAMCHLPGPVSCRISEGVRGGEGGVRPKVCFMCPFT